MLFRALSILLFLVPGAFAQSFNLFNAYNPANTWATLAIGAGGWVTGIDIATDGTKVVRTDTWGGYWWNGTRWAQCVTTASMPAADVGMDNSTGDPKTTPQGVYEIVVAPSNTQRFYMMFNGRVYRTDNQCATWTRTNFTRVTTRIDPNSTSYKHFGKKIAVDPNNADIVYAGTGGDGLFVSLDAGANWSLVSDVAISTTANVGSILVAFDPSASVVGGKTQTIYASSYGNGVYVSTNGGASWTLTTGTQTTHSHLFVSAGGIVYLTVNVASDGPYKYASGSWSHLTGPGSQTWQTISVDPANPNRIILGNDAGIINQSTDGGSTWTGVYNLHFPNCSGCITSTDIPWLSTWTTAPGNTYAGYLTNGNMQFDPSVSNTIYISHGTGVFYGNLPSTYSAFNWIDRSIGIEQLVGNNIIVPPGSRPSVYSWDRPIFYSSALTSYPSGYNPSYAVAINSGWSGDWSPQTNSTLVCLCNWFGPRDYSAKSLDSGQTWTVFATMPSLTGGGGVSVGGSISVASDSHYIIVQNGGNSAGVFYTSDSGATWTESQVGTIPLSTGGSDTGWGISYSLNRRVGVCDKVTQNLCWLYNSGLVGGDVSKAGIYKSTTWPPSWSKVYSGVITTLADGLFNVKLRSVPGKTGHLWYTGGSQTGVGAIGGTQDLKRSTDSGTTWASVPNIKNVYAIGFGKETNGGAYPAVYIAGFVTFNGGSTYAWGIYRSTNADQATPTWTLLSNYPLNSFDTVTWIEGDMTAYGDVYVAFRGSGYAYGRFP